MSKEGINAISLSKLVIMLTIVYVADEDEEDENFTYKKITLTWFSSDGAGEVYRFSFLHIDHLRFFNYIWWFYGSLLRWLWCWWLNTFVGF